MAKKTSAWVRQETISSSKIGKEVQKPYCGKGPGWLSFLDYAQSIFFFSCLIGYGIEVTTACRVIKKLKIDHLWLYMLYPTPWSNGNSPLHIYRERLLHGWWVSTIFIHELWRIANERVSAANEWVCDSSQQVNKNRTSEPTMKLFVYFISTEISFKQ